MKEVKEEHENMAKLAKASARLVQLYGQEEAALADLKNIQDEIRSKTGIVNQIMASLAPQPAAREACDECGLVLLGEDGPHHAKSCSLYDGTKVRQMAEPVPADPHPADASKRLKGPLNWGVGKGYRVEDAPSVFDKPHIASIIKVTYSRGEDFHYTDLLSHLGISREHPRWAVYAQRIGNHCNQMTRRWPKVSAKNAPILAKTDKLGRYRRIR